jgi:hypothetical protein
MHAADFTNVYAQRSLLHAGRGLFWGQFIWDAEEDRAEIRTGGQKVRSSEELIPGSSDLLIF